MAAKLPNFVPGEPFDARKVERLKRVVEANTPARGGPGVRIRKQPWGWTAKYSSSSSFVPQTWRVAMTGAYPKNLAITIGRGLVGGIEPVIQDQNGKWIPISGNPATKPPTPPPQLAIPQSAFNQQQQQACLYLQATMISNGDPTQEWFIQRVTPVALPGLPPLTPFTAFKLLGFFILASGAVQYQQMCFFNLGLGTIFQRTATGAARYIWYASS